MPRWVTMYSQPGSAWRSLARRVLMWVSTVRSVLSLSSPQAASSSCSREWMRPGPRSSAPSRRTSRRVSASGTPCSRMRWPARSTSNPPGALLAGAGAIALRRSSAFTRATSSRGLKGLLT